MRTHAGFLVQTSSLIHNGIHNSVDTLAAMREFVAC